jgi:flavin reductase (DIM6/NTAB) family NADH-FMN oxidoreductase RutF/DNA-binding IclR family transcriptional regulator
MTALTSFDKRQLRNVLGTFTTGVTIVTTCDAKGTCHGVTANSFSSVSLDPPLVLWSQALTSKSFPAFRDSEHFVVNILADDQVSISNHFAKSQEDKFSGVAHSPGLGGAPVLDGTVAHLECVKFAAYPGGDHVVYLGRVERVGFSNRRPLAFGSGRYVVPIAHDLGPVSLQIGSAMPAYEEAVRIASEALPHICESVGQYTLCIAVWGNHGPTIIRWEPSRHPVSPHLRTGLVMNVTSTAAGRAFAAFLPPEATRSFVDEDLRLFRGVDEDEGEQRRRFDEEIALTRQHGIARTVDPQPAHRLHRIATNAFSAPIFDADGNMVMAVSLVAETSRLDADWDGRVPRALLSAANALSAQLGWSGTRRTDVAA